MKRIRQFYSLIQYRLSQVTKQIAIGKHIQHPLSIPIK